MPVSWKEPEILVGFTNSNCNSLIRSHANVNHANVGVCTVNAPDFWWKSRKASVLEFAASGCSGGKFRLINTQLKLEPDKYLSTFDMLKLFETFPQQWKYIYSVVVLLSYNRAADQLTLNVCFIINVVLFLLTVTKPTWGSTSTMQICPRLSCSPPTGDLYTSHTPQSWTHTLCKQRQGWY